MYANTQKNTYYSANNNGRRIHITINGNNFNNFGNPNNLNTKILRKNDPVFIDIYLTLEELYTGVSKKIPIERQINNGRIFKSETEVLTIDVKEGWKEGTKITFTNKGNIEPNVEPGDVIFIIKQTPHPVFERENNDLVAILTITQREARNGFERSIKNLKGDNLIVDSKRMASSNSFGDHVHVVQNEGMPIRKEGKIVGYGNMIIKFNIEK